MQARLDYVLQFVLADIEPIFELATVDDPFATPATK
jgi:hypothetical protein